MTSREAQPAPDTGVATALPPDAMLIDNDALLRALLYTAVDAILAIDSDGHIGLFNPAAEQLFGYTASEVLGQNVKMLMPADVADEHDGYIHRYRETQERRIIGRGREVFGLRKDGSRFPMELAVSEFECDGKKCFAGVIRDVTPRHEAERRESQRLAQLAHAGRLSVLGEMSSGIAHELNQPLAAIVGFAEACERLSAKGTLTPALLEGTLEKIVEQGRRASGIVTRLRQLARKDSGVRQNIDLNALVRDVLVLYTHDPRLDYIKLEVALGDEALQVHAVRTQIEQVIINLLQNALEALAEDQTAGGRVAVSTERADISVKFRIEDNGPGIVDEDLVFESFYTGKRNGLGLGLSICRSIIGDHDGTLQATKLKQGTRFEFVLPLACEP